MNIHIQDVLRVIAAGGFDEDLESLGEVVRGRKKDVRNSTDRAKFLEAQVGQRVRFNETTRPTRAIGQEGTIVEKKLTKVVVKIDKASDEDFKSDGYYGNVTTPMSLIDFID